MWDGDVMRGGGDVFGDGYGVVARWRGGGGGGGESGGDV